MTGDGTVELSWAVCTSRLVERVLPHVKGKKVYGIPRGGAYVAAMLASECILVGRPEDADVMVDDIIDSGVTRDANTSVHKKPYYALVDKQTDARDATMPWVNFPWDASNGDEHGPEDNVRRLLQYVGEDPSREGLVDTPARVSRSLRELTRGYREDPADHFKAVFTEAYDEMVAVRGIEVWSLCEHHMLPFHGVAHVGYIPDGRVLGLSKVARVVECFSRRLQVQERLTEQIAKTLEHHLQPKGVGVVIEATHLCMAMRGVNKPARMSTSCLLGAMRGEARSEFLALCRNGSK